MMQLEPYFKPQAAFFNADKIIDIPASKKRICSISWNKSGSKLIAGSTDSTIRVRNCIRVKILQMFKYTNTGLVPGQSFKDHKGQIEALCWNPESENQFASTSSDKSFKIWDAKSSKLIRTEKTKEENLNLQYNPQGNLLVLSNLNDELCFYDVRMYKIVKQIKFKNEVNDFSWDRSSEGNTLFVADSSGAISVIDG